MAGEYPGAATESVSVEKLNRILASGIDTFVDLTECGEPAGLGPLQPYQPLLPRLSHEHGRSVNYYHRPIRDLHITTAEQMAETLDLIDSEIAVGRTVYVHCRGGIGRTGTVVGCYLARHGTATGEDALAFVRVLGRETPHGRNGWQSPETTEQIDMVRNWQIDK